MAYEHLITADWHGTDVFTSSEGTSRSSTQKRTGGFSMKQDAYYGGHSIAVASNATKYVGVGAYSITSNSTAVHIAFREGSTFHVTVVLDTSAGTIKVKRGTQSGTELGSGGTISTNAWYYLGIKVVVNGSTGIVTVNLDGTEVIALTSQNTQNGGTGVIDNIFFQVSGDACYFDDLKVRDDAIPGVGGIYVYVPTGDGADTGWTASAGSRYQCVDDAPATYTDYISTDVATTGTKSTFTHAAMAATAYSSIPCVCAAAIAKLDASGSGNSRAIVKSSSSYSNGSSVALSTSSKYLHAFATVDPATSAAWTKSGVGSAEPGVETV